MTTEELRHAMAVLREHLNDALLLNHHGPRRPAP